MASVSLLAGLLASVASWRTTGMFFGLVISWAILTGLIELIGALRDRRADASRARGTACSSAS